MSLAPFVQAQVIAHADDNSAVYVQFKSGQLPGAPIKMMYQGYADPLRVKQTPLPQRGTWGVVMFLNGDIRNGLWLGAFYPNQMTALTSPASGTDPAIDYEAHWSGYWRQMDGGGNMAMQWPDGSSLTVAAATGMPTVYRQVVNGQQKQVQAPFTMAQRVTTTPSAFVMDLNHSSGFRITVAANGDLAITGSASGHGSKATVSMAGTTLVMNSPQISGDGWVTLDLIGGAKLEIQQASAGATDFLVLVSKFLTLFNNHVHSGIQAGGSNSGTPTVAATNANTKSNAINISG